MRLTEHYVAPQLRVMQLATKSLIANTKNGVNDSSETNGKPHLELNSLPPLARPLDPLDNGSFWDEF